MQTSATIKIKASELNSKWLRSIKALFGDKEVEVSVAETMDETEYLLSSPANAKMLLDSIKSVEEGGKLITVDVESLLSKMNNNNA